MDIQESLIGQWRQERGKVRSRLLEKIKTQQLTDVEIMILNPFTAQQARDQVEILNKGRSVNPDQQKRRVGDTYHTDQSF